MNWSPQQDRALKAVNAWLKSKDSPFFYLGGYAGTGKTTLAKHFAQDVNYVLYGSFTGKAASVMRDKGCTNATTIHRLIYESRSKSAERLRELKEALKAATNPIEISTLRIKIQEEVARLKQPHFLLNPDSRVRDADLVIIDECSMVNPEMGRDLLSFGTPVLVLGDPAQLPPVFGTGFFIGDEPDVMLTEVHRQARESGILRLATDIRQGKAIDYCDLGDAMVLPKGELNPDNVPTYHQIIVGRNKTRHATNRRMRELLGRETPWPETGDRLVCLRNNHDLGLLNGEIYRATHDASVWNDETVGLCIEAEDGTHAQNLDAWQAPFLGEKLEHYSHNGDIQEFDYGYVLTCHKAQGSQWPTVIVFDESHCFRGNWHTWLYTACTRASDYLAIIR